MSPNGIRLSEKSQLSRLFPTQRISTLLPGNFFGFVAEQVPAFLADRQHSRHKPQAMSPHHERIPPKIFGRTPICRFVVLGDFFVAKVQHCVTQQWFSNTGCGKLRTEKRGGSPFFPTSNILLLLEAIRPANGVVDALERMVRKVQWTCICIQRWLFVKQVACDEAQGEIFEAGIVY